ncbi:MAG: hypothetical protein QOH60_976 [Mycobacterium sp.]|nr:hypothetical protein [Mycobacterium sp.]
MPQRLLKPTMRIATLALLASTTLAATVTLPANADADFDYQRFQTPSGNILCMMLREHSWVDPARAGTGVATCQVQDPVYPPPPREYTSPNGQTSTCYLAGWGSQIALTQGSPPYLSCLTGVLTTPPLSTLAPGQTKSVGTLTCASEPPAIRCTDSSTGHFFRMSRDSYDLG